jgi:hypothetical protein
VPNNCIGGSFAQPQRDIASEHGPALMPAMRPTPTAHRRYKNLPRRHCHPSSLIRLKRIYNFLCSMLIFTPFALCFVTLRGVFMHFLELTY